MSRRDLLRGAGLALGMAGLVAVLAVTLDDPPAVRIARATSILLLSLPPLLLALPGWLRCVRESGFGRGGRWLYAAALVAALLPERLARGTVVDLLGPALYAAAPLLLTIDRPREPRPLPRDLLLVALLWLPLELRWLAGDFTLLRLFGLDLLLLLYLVERPFWDPGRVLPGRLGEVAWGVGAYVAFLVVAIPFALATGFALPGIANLDLGGWALFVAGTFWVIALPEEALFRGVIQTLLERWLPRTWPALALASVVFGLAHLNNHNGDPPDWRYVLLATVAGVAYGLAFLRTRNLAAPVLTHFLVDVTWRGFFAGLQTG